MIQRARATAPLATLVALALALASCCPGVCPGESPDAACARVTTAVQHVCGAGATVDCSTLLGPECSGAGTSVCSSSVDLVVAQIGGARSCDAALGMSYELVCH